MKGINQIREDLLVMYKEWANEFKEIDNGRFLTEQYSNPYYISIPDNWFDNNVRIMIVGEEGFGEWGVGKQYGWRKGEDPWAFDDFEKIINYNRIKTLKQVGTKLNLEEAGLCNKTNNKFWIRYNNIYKLGLPCVWNNLDKIHLLGNKNCALSKKDREKLHSGITKILAKEIEILKPTIILFCGWNDRNKAFKQEIPKIYDRFFVKAKYDYEEVSDCIYNVKTDKRCYIFTRHPNSRKKPKFYEENIVSILKTMIMDQL